jgi:crotonobetainyl-CoA:carnitine CoA-transferase CaiB-like acyl-CoA transferase
VAAAPGYTASIQEVAAMKAPLEGVRVVEIAHYVAVPGAGALLSDLGADVIKIELPPKGEIYRRSRPAFAGFQTDFPDGPGFHFDNRGKRSLMLDLTNPDARAALLRVIDGADVVTTNLLPARRAKYGVDHESLLARKPSLVVAAINGYGLGGEEADRPAFDYAAYWARTGMMDLMRDEGVPPSMLRPGVGDHAAASNLVIAILAALRMRDATGQGRYVEVSLLQTGLYILGCDVALSLVTREPLKRHDRKSAGNALWNSYRTADDRWLMLVMIDPTQYWPRLCAAIERPDIETDPRWAEPFTRVANSAALIEQLEREFAKQPLSVWRKRLDAAGLIWSPVNRVDEVIDDPQARAMGYFAELEHPSDGRAFETLGAPFRMEGVPLGSRRACSNFDADGEAILREAGLDESEIAKLREA